MTLIALYILKYNFICLGIANQGQMESTPSSKNTESWPGRWESRFIMAGDFQIKDSYPRW